jgi:putative heme-binding domain-containing protein
VREHGNATRGAAVYERAELACVACHSIADKGGTIGPPLDAIGSGQPLDFIIGAVLEPQREIKESYEAMEITAKDGRIMLGYLVARDAESLTVRDPTTLAETRFTKGEVAKQRAIGSFMPAGLVDQLSREELRDLFRYLSELGKPKLSGN